MSETKQQPYFPHNANSRNDDSLIRLRIEHGVAGYGVYYMLLERLRLADGYQCALDYEILSWDLDCDVELIRSVIYDFGLFITVQDGQMFQSVELNEYMRIMEEKRQERAARARAAAEARWGKQGQDASPADVTAGANGNTTAAAPQPVREEAPQVDDSKETDRLDEELEVMKADEVWFTTLVESTKKTKEELLGFFPDFKQRCILGGIRNGHKNMVDAETHFESWLYKSGCVKIETEEEKLKALSTRTRGKKSETEIQREKDVLRKERNEEFKKREANKCSPKEWVRNQGYDPEKVTLMQIMRPAWREKNPPTHPEWIVKGVTEPAEAEPV